MSTGQEIEFKFGVGDESAFVALIETLDLAPLASHDLKRQINHFFDTPSRSLRRSGIALRLRIENGRHIVTVKGRETRSVDYAM